MPVLVHQENRTHKYYAYGFMGGLCCYVFLMSLIVIIPIFTVYLSEGMWEKINMIYEQPTVEFTQKSILLVSVDDSYAGTKPYIWTSNGALNNLIHPLIFPTVSVSSTDTNSDSKKDSFNITVEFPTNQESVRSVELLLFFTATYNRISLEGLIPISKSGDAGSKYTVGGDIKLNQHTMLTGWSTTKQPESFDFTSITTLKDLDLLALKATYFDRSNNLQFEQVYETWLQNPSETFRMEIYMKIPSQIILYRARIFRVLKMAWVQLLAVGIVVYWGVMRINRFLVLNGIVNTRLVVVE